MQKKSKVEIQRLLKHWKGVDKKEQSDEKRGLLEKRLFFDKAQYSWRTIAIIFDLFEVAKNSF